MGTHRVYRVFPHVPVRWWVLSMLIPPRLLLAAQPKRVTALLQLVHHTSTRILLEWQAGLKADEADNGDVAPIQRYGLAVNLYIPRVAW